MAIAVLEVEQYNLALKLGTYLIRGPGAPNSKSEHSLHIDNESIDDKHAMIIAKVDGIFIYDLDTRIGTFVNEQRLPALTEYSISADVSIRFGAVEGKLSKCSTLEQHHSSGFHDESLHLALDQTNEAENLTIPETQCVSPENCVYAYEKYNNKNVSNDSSIPETQEILELAATIIPSTKETETLQPSISNKDDEASQFCISSQEFNDGFDDTADSNSRDLLDNLNWLIDHEEPTTIQQPSTYTERDNNSNASKSGENNQQQAEMQNVSNKETEVEADAQQGDLLRSQAHTPDLFDVTLLEEFEKKEARLNKSKASRSHSENSIAKETNVEFNKDDSFEERTHTATVINFIDEATSASEKIASETTNAPSVVAKEGDAKDEDEDAKDKEDAIENESSNPSASTRTIKQVNQADIDLFHDEKMENALGECDNLSDQPLQHSNKENMILGVATLKDLEPTQVFISKKTMKPPQLPVPTSNTTSKNEPLLESDLEPTQVFVPKKQKVESSLQTSTEKMTAPAVDEKDLVPTQKFVPKKSLIKPSGSNVNVKDEPINLNSTMIQSAHNEPVKLSAKSFFAEVDGSLQDENPASCPGTPKNLQPAKETSFMLTPEIISTTFEEQKPPDTESRRKLLSRPDSDSDSDSEDSLTRLLTKPRVSSDFDSLIDSIKKNEESRNLQNSMNQKDDIMQKYVDTIKSETPKKKRKLESKPVAEVSTKRDASEEPPSCNKRLRTKINDKQIDTKDKGASLTSDMEKTKDNNSSENIKKHCRPKRTASVDETAVFNSKIRKMKSNSSDAEKPSASRTTTRNAKNLNDNLQETTTTSRTENRVRKTSKSNSSDAETSSTSATKNTKPLTNSCQETKTTARARKMSNSSSSSTKSKTSSKFDEMKKITKINRSESESSTISRTSARLRSQSSTSINSEKQSQTIKAKVTSRNTRLKTIDDQPANATIDSNDKSTKNTKSRRERKHSIEKHEIYIEPKNVDSNSSIMEVQGKITRSRSRQPSIVSSSQIAKLQSDSRIEKPTTSKAAKKHTTTEPKSALKVAFTMVEPEQKEELLKHTNKKWEEVKDAAETEVLVMDVGNRTLKFLIAVAKGIPIVTTKWLEAIRETGVISVRSKYFFKDATFEKNFKFSLLHTLNEAKKAKLFTNFQFLLTTNILPNPSDMKMIITCAGGTILQIENIPKEQENQHIYLVSSETDRQHWHSYRRKNTNICITNTEAVMLAIMRYDFKILKKRGF